MSRGVDFHPNFADALEVQRVLDALQRSVTTRQWTTIEREPATRSARGCHTHRLHEHRANSVRPLVEDAVDDRRRCSRRRWRSTCSIARSSTCSRRSCARRTTGRATQYRLHRGGVPSRHDDRAGAGGIVHGSRRHPHRPGHDLCRMVDRRRRPGAGCLARRIHRAALPDGPDRVRQLHRGNQGDRGPVSRREPLDRRRGLQRGRAARIGDRAAVRAALLLRERLGLSVPMAFIVPTALGLLWLLPWLAIFPDKDRMAAVSVKPAGGDDHGGRSVDHASGSSFGTARSWAVPDPRVLGPHHHVLLDVAAAVPANRPRHVVPRDRDLRVAAEPLRHDGQRRRRAADRSSGEADRIRRSRAQAWFRRRLRPRRAQHGDAVRVPTTTRRSA